MTQQECLNGSNLEPAGPAVYSSSSCPRHTAAGPAVCSSWRGPDGISSIRSDTKGGRLTAEMENHGRSSRVVASPAVTKEGTSRPELDGVTRPKRRRLVGHV